MNKFFTLITAVSVSVHAILGCCAHAVQGATCCEKLHSACTEHAHHEHAHATESDNEPAPDKGHGCCRVRCQWMAPDAPSDLVVALLWHAAIFDADQVAVLSAATHWRCDFSPLDTLPTLPLRTHLALGVLLI
jgi:hypothetical protein